jgi:hypothetical protein
VNTANRYGIEEVELLAAAAFGDDQAGLLEHAQVLHDAKTSHRQPALERAQRLPVALEQLVEQAAAGGVANRPEDVVHRHDA